MRRLLLIVPLLMLATASLEARKVYRFESVVTRAASLSGEPSSLFYPSGVAVDAAGTVWIADTANHVIRAMQPDGRLEVVAGTVGLPGADDGPRTNATFRYPQGLAFDLAGNLYIADSGNGTVRRLRPDGVVETFAGNAAERGTEDGDRRIATFVTPIGLAWDVSGELWVSDFSAHTIRRVGRDGRVSTVSGIAGEPGMRDGPGDEAQFFYPAGIDVDARGRLWVADSGNGSIRIVELDGFTATAAGSPDAGGHRDGSSDQAGFDHPSDVAVREDGTVFVTDSWSHTIRTIDADGVSTIAGAPGVEGFADGRGDAVRFYYPLAVALGPDDSIFVADMLNHAIREGTEDRFGSRRRRAVGR